MTPSPRTSSALWGDGWTVCCLLPPHLHYLGCHCDGAIPPSEEEPMDQQPLSSLDFKWMLWRSSWCWPRCPLPGSRRYPKLSREREGRRRGCFDLARKKGKCFLSWLSRRGSILAEATYPPCQRVLFRFLSKAVQANSGPFTSSIQLNILDLGFFPLSTSQWD